MSKTFRKVYGCEGKKICNDLIEIIYRLTEGPRPREEHLCFSGSVSGTAWLEQLSSDCEIFEMLDYWIQSTLVFKKREQTGSSLDFLVSETATSASVLFFNRYCNLQLL